MRIFKVVKKMRVKPSLFGGFYKEGDVLYMSDEITGEFRGALFDTRGNFVCSFGSPLQLGHTVEITGQYTVDHVPVDKFVHAYNI